MARSSFLRRLAAPPLLLAAALGCGADLVLPELPTASDFRINVVDGDGQVGTVGEPLDGPLLVSVRTPTGEPVADWQVAFAVESADGGTVSPDTAVTGDDGVARAHWTLGTKPGSYLVEARVVGPEEDVPSARFEAVARPGAPDTVRAVSPPNQPGRTHQEVEDSPTVLVVDRFGNPVDGATVRWEVAAGDGEVSEPVARTGADGRSVVRWTLGSRVGVQKLNAVLEGDVEGSPVVFTATVLF